MPGKSDIFKNVPFHQLAQNNALSAALTMMVVSSVKKNRACHMILISSEQEAECKN